MHYGVRRDMIDEHTKPTSAVAFEEFFAEAEPRLRRALVGGFGTDVGGDAAAEALAVGWRDWSRIATLDNPAGYLYRVGERWARRQLGRGRRFGVLRREPVVTWTSTFEPGLDAALASLSLRQRQVVVLVSGFAMTHADAAALLGLSRSSVQSHAERGMAKLRDAMGVDQ
jgi:RNA polymerase sigma-70 factor (ECF subfamily)